MLSTKNSDSKHFDYEHQMSKTEGKSYSKYK